MTTVEQNGLNGRDMRIKLFDLMKSKGIVDNVKSHLRGRLIHELRGGIDDKIRFSSSTTQPTLLIRAINSLIVDYFQSQKYDYATSVFIPEANINDYRTMSDEEILRLLNISTESTFYKKIKSNNEINGHTNLLTSMLICVSSWLPGASQSNGTQTSNDLWAGSISGSTLDEKLNNLDAMYNNRRDDLSSMHNLSTEEKLLLFQKNVELRTKENLKQQMDQFRENEIKKIRDDERLKCQMELQTLRKELETLYHSKQETLNEKEMRIGDRSKAELDNERRDLFAQRQTFLEELKAMKFRETENQRNLELRERSITLEADRLKRLEDDIRKREVALSNVEIHVDQQVQMKLNKLRFEIEQQFTERNKNLQLIEMRNQEEARRISEERLFAEQAKTEVASLRKNYSAADSNIHRLQSEIKVLQNENDILREKAKQTVDYQSIREENAVLKSQMNNLPNRSQRSNRARHDSSSSYEQPTHSKGILRELKTVLDNRTVVNDELVDLKTQIALLQSSNQPEPYLNGRFPTNHGGDYLSRVMKSTSDVQLNQSHRSTSSNYNQFIEDAKLRMFELDREADNVEESFRDYQHRIMTKTSYAGNAQPSEFDYPSTRRMPSVKQNTTTNTILSSASLQDINQKTQKFTINSSETGSNVRQRNISHSDDRIFEHPEITIKPTTLDDRIQRRLMTTKSFNLNENGGGGSVPNILEHPDMKSPVVLKPQQTSSSSSSSYSSNNKKLIRQQSADATLARRTSPTNQTNSARSTSPQSLIGDIIESPEAEKSDESLSLSPTTKGPVKIIRQYSEASSVSDNNPTGKRSNDDNHKTQSEEDDFW